MDPKTYAGILAKWSRWWISAAATLLILAVVVWSTTQLSDRAGEPVVAPAADEGSTPRGLPSAVEEYLQFAATADDRRSDGGDGQVADGLRKLAGALGMLNVGSPDLPIDLRVGAEHLLLNPSSTETAAMIRDDLIAAAGALEPGTDAGRPLRAAAESIRPDRPLTEQRAVVLHFFRRAADALAAVAR